jgi:hypothetical protein
MPWFAWIAIVAILVFGVTQEIEDRTPAKSKVNLAAEDRWRIAMLEARLEEVEKNRKTKKDGEDPEPDNALA